MGLCWVQLGGYWTLFGPYKLHSLFAYLAEMISVRYMNSDMIPPCLTIPTFIGGNIGGTRDSRGSRKGVVSGLRGSNLQSTFM